MSNRERGNRQQGSFAGNLAGRALGLVLAAAFLAFVKFAPVPLLQRYFLGHPIAVVTTVLFCVALGLLWNRYRQIARAKRMLGAISDYDLVPEALHSLCGWKAPGDVTANQPPSSHAESLTINQRILMWGEHLVALPSGFYRSILVTRLSDLLDRQHRRGHADQVSEDMRDAADRQADADYEALQFVRIIVWAIPMLGFLGTVVGITQTLGGLDFTDGAAAVERLKSGLYVAFDTTALGLVLSVLAIFIQFPVEKMGRAVLEEVDYRSGQLIPAVLSAKTKVDASDPSTALRQMTLEISQTVRDSVRMQAELWKQVIDEAHAHWHQAAAHSTDDLTAALRELIGESLSGSLKQHADALRRVQREGADQIDNRWQQWQTALSDNARVLLAHQKTLLNQGELLADCHARAQELHQLQTTLDQNISLVSQNVATVDQGLRSLQSTENMADAMRTLARAVELLAQRAEAADSTTKTRARRNAA